MSKYEIAMEIAGPFAMWTRPDTGATPTSYPIPSWSAVKGIFESIAFFNDGKAWVRPTRVQICKRKGVAGGGLSFQKYTNNYRGILRSAKSIKENNSFQFTGLILADVCYRLYGVIENGSGAHLRNGDNPCHALQSIFYRRLRNGQCHKTPTLGWNEFVPSYWGPLRDVDNPTHYQTEVDKAINIDLVSMLQQTFDKAIAGDYKPSFVQSEKAIIKNGEYSYA